VDVPRLAVIVTGWVEATAVVVMVNAAFVWPAATATETGTWAFGLLDESMTCDPAVGAGLARVTVPVPELPPFTVVGFKVRLCKVGATTVPCTMKLVAVDVAPGVSGLVTVIGNVPGRAKLGAATAAESWLALVKVVASGWPLKLTLAPGTKFVPTIVSVRLLPPACAEFGMTLVIVGAAAAAEKPPAACAMGTGY
jgi:hypothetical protein